MNNTKNDEKKASVMSLLWLLGFAIGCYVEGAAGLIIIALVTALCVMYVRHDIERERKEKVREKVKEMFREEMKVEQK